MSNFDMIEKKAGVEAAYSLFRAIADYSMFGLEPDFTSIDNSMIQLALDSTFQALKPNIDTSRRNSKANFASDERNEREIMVVNFKKEHPGASFREISDKTGVPKSTVERILGRCSPAVEAAPEGMSQDAQRTPDQTSEEGLYCEDPDDLPF